MPRKPTETVQVNLRMKEGLRRRLEREAEKQGVSLNSLMTRRLEGDLDAEERLAASLGGQKNFELLQLVGRVIARIEAETGRSWEEDVPTRVRVSRSIGAIMNGFQHLDVDPSKLSVEDALNALTGEFPAGATIAGAAMAGPLVKRIMHGDPEDVPEADETNADPGKQREANE